MAYFKNFQEYSFLCSDLLPEGKHKRNEYLRIPEESKPMEKIFK